MTATASKTSQKNKFKLLHTSFSIPPRSIRQVLSNLSGVQIIKNVLKYRKRKRKSSSCVHLLHKTWNWALSRRSRAVTAKECTITSDASASCCFAYLNLMLFWRSGRSRLRRCLSSHSCTGYPLCTGCTPLFEEFGLVKLHCLCLSNGILRLYWVCSLPYFFFFFNVVW